MGAAQILIWSYSCVFLPPMSTAITTSGILLWELSMTFYIFHRHRVCLVDHVDLICSLYSWREGLGSSSLATLPLGFNCGFITTSTCGSATGVWLLRLPSRAWVCPCEGQVWKWYSCFSRRGSGSSRYSGGLVIRVVGNIVPQKGMATSIGQYAPVFFPREPHL